MKKIFNYAFLLTVLAMGFAMNSCGSDGDDNNGGNSNVPSDLFGYWITTEKTDSYYWCSMLTFTSSGGFQSRVQEDNDTDGFNGKYTYNNGIVVVTETDGTRTTFQIVSVSASTLTINADGDVTTFTKTDDGTFPYYKSHKGKPYIGTWRWESSDGEWEEYTFNIHGEFVNKLNLWGTTHTYEGTYSYSDSKAINLNYSDGSHGYLRNVSINSSGTYMNLKTKRYYKQ